MIQRESGGLCVAQTVPLCSCRLDIDGAWPPVHFSYTRKAFVSCLGRNTWAAIAQSA